MATNVDAATPGIEGRPVDRADNDPLPRLKSATAERNQHDADSAVRRRRVLNIATAAAAVVSATFGVIDLVTSSLWHVAITTWATALIFVTIPLLHRFGALVAPLALIITADVLMIVVSLGVGTHTGIAFFFLMSALVAVLVLGYEHFILACVVVAVSAAITITMHVVAPIQSDEQPAWAQDVGFSVSAIAAGVMIVSTVWYALSEIQRAKNDMQREYERSEALLANILPTSVAARLKDPVTTIIADKYDDASVLFADIAGYTERASQTTPAELVLFLNRFYSEFDSLVERHGLEKVKTTGDCYMAVGGVPHHRPDHLKALARLALDLADVANGLTDLSGNQVPIRVGLSVGPVVAGVVGTRRFFYDVWGDAVNVASRMESTSVRGRIQVSPPVYERLKDEFVFEERGKVLVKGKGELHTWFLVGELEPEATLVGQSTSFD